MAICKCSPEHSYMPHTDLKHELVSPHKCLVPDCDCQEFVDQGHTWNDTFVRNSRKNEL